jgi:hypothetical protein
MYVSPQTSPDLNEDIGILNMKYIYSHSAKVFVIPISE